MCECVRALRWFVCDVVVLSELGEAGCVFAACVQCMASNDLNWCVAIYNGIGNQLQPFSALHCIVVA